MSILFDNETLLVLIKSNQKKFTPLIAQSLLQVIQSIDCCIYDLLKQPELPGVLLKIIKSGYLVSKYLTKAEDFNRSLA